MISTRLVEKLQLQDGKLEPGTDAHGKLFPPFPPDIVFAPFLPARFRQRVPHRVIYRAVLGIVC